MKIPPSCNRFSNIIPCHVAYQTLSQQTILKLDVKIENLSSSVPVVHAIAKQELSRRCQDGNGCEMFKIQKMKIARTRSAILLQFCNVLVVVDVTWLLEHPIISISHLLRLVERACFSRRSPVQKNCHNVALFFCNHENRFALNVFSNPG